MKITYTFIMKVLPALLAALCWTSCSDFLEEDPKGQLPSDTYFSNKEDLDASLTALYSVIASSQASNNLCGIYTFIRLETISREIVSFFAAFTCGTKTLRN